MVFCVAYLFVSDTLCSLEFIRFVESFKFLPDEAKRFRRELPDQLSLSGVYEPSGFSRTWYRFS